MFFSFLCFIEHYTLENVQCYNVHSFGRKLQAPVKKIIQLFIYTIPLFCFSQSLTKAVNPFIGTGGHGHTYPGATVPFGMVQLSPDTRTDASWDGCGGYHHADSFIYGFSHTHLSGTGVPDYCDILLMPMVGMPKPNPIDYRSQFSHASEKAAPGYYKVKLNNHNVVAELTATQRVGFHQYTFPKIGPVSIILDLKHRDQLLGWEIKAINKSKIQGFRRSSGWAKDESVYFVIEFSEPFIKNYFYEGNTKAGFLFIKKNKNPIQVKVGISFTSIEGANANLNAELSGWDFEKTIKKADSLWNLELTKIKIQTKDSTQKTIFYTALYHCFTQPNIANDVDGKYLGRDFKIHTAQGHNYYSVFSLWDTYRAWHPLMTIIDRKRSLDFIKTFLLQYEQGGRLPVWELASNETDCMIGYHSVSVIADAWLKGITGYDSALALKAMLHSANSGLFGLPSYTYRGYLGAEVEGESVSKTLEYAYDDWCISAFSASLGEQRISDQYLKRSRNWYNLFDPETGFMRPRSNGNWLSFFDAKEVNNHFTEANSWQYSFYVPQDVVGLVKAHGGTEPFANKLDLLFSENSKTTGREQADISGLIGQYAHGNEPSHHMAYLYNYTFLPGKTQQIVHNICTLFYKNAPDGLIGNEDCGQMSAWYVLSSLGLYQVTPGSPYYAIGTPLFEKAEIALENGNIFNINTSHFNYKDWYSMPEIEGTYSHFMTYNQIMNGNELHFKMQNTPVEDAIYALPEVLSPKTDYPAPPLISANRIFKNSTPVSIKAIGNNQRLYYYLNDDTFNPKFYTRPFTIEESQRITAFSVKEEGVETLKSPVSEAQLYEMPHDWEIVLQSKYDNQYHAGGPEGLIDGIRGSSSWRAGDWQGYQAQDFEATIDLKESKPINKVSVGFLQDTRSWILMPLKFEVFISTDNKNFILAGSAENKISAKELNVTIQDLKVTIRNAKAARYVKIKAYNFGKLPEWHQGFPFKGDAYIFVDEITIE